MDGDLSRLKSTLEGRLLVADDHPNRINCQLLRSTATTSTVLNGCGAPGATVALYVTDIQYSSSVASSTTGDEQMNLQGGTGGSCGTGTGVFFSAYGAANTGVTVNFKTPIKLGANREICMLHAGVGSKTVVLNGYIAP
mgnify:FL=1